MTSDRDHVTVTIDGHPVTTAPGRTLAAVMLTDGIRAWRSTSRRDRPRGLFCGIGVCFDCLVTVDGVRDVRACQRIVEDGDTVTFQRDAHADTASGEEAAQ